MGKTGQHIEHRPGEMALQLYAATPPAQAWTDLEWVPKQQRKPSREDGCFVVQTGKVMVWVLTQAALAQGRDPEACGFHLQSRSFDDDCEGGDDEVILWSPMCDRTAGHQVA